VQVKARHARKWPHEALVRATMVRTMTITEDNEMEDKMNRGNCDMEVERRKI
jgi:hypothetical protein